MYDLWCRLIKSTKTKHEKTLGNNHGVIILQTFNAKAVLTQVEIEKEGLQLRQKVLMQLAIFF